MEIDYSKLGERTREGKTYDETMVALQELYFGRKALRVNPRGKQWLAVYRAHQVCEFNCLRTIFLDSLGQKLSRNVFVVSILSFWKKLSVRKGFFMTPKTRDFHDFSTFLEIS